MDYNKIAKDILDNVGGESNVQNMVHCFTRLRFNLKDDSKANKEVVSHLEGVIQVVESGGLFQVVLGSKVEKVYDAMMPMLSLDENAAEENSSKKGNAWNNVLQMISQMFTPLVPAIAASGLIKGLLTAARLIMNNRGVDISTSDTYVILFAASQVIFYFMPIFLAYTSAIALKCNPIIAMSVGATLVYPQIDAMIQDISVKTSVFGLPVTKGAWQIGESARVFSYAESVIPIILAVIVLAYLEKFLKKYVPAVLQIIMVPGLSLLIMIPVTLVVLGPVGIYVGNGIQLVYNAVMGFNATLGGALVGGLWGVFVIFGAHRALLPVGLNDVAVSGRQNLLAFAGAANFSQGGAALGVMLKTKNKDLKGVSASAVISAALVGVTEPAIYGCNLRLKKPMVCAVICGAIGGGLMGFGGVYGDAFANNGVLTIFTYAAFGMSKFIFYLVGCAIAFFGAAAMTYFVGFDDIPEKNVTKKATVVPEVEKNDTVVTETTADIKITAPVEGLTIPLSEVKDEVFSSEALGKGVAIVPTKGEIVAPCDCTLAVMYPTGHALGFTLDNGVELLIHIGMNTVDLNGKYFEKHVEAGQKVTKGTKIVSFDIDKIKAEGYDVTIPILISNTDSFAAINGNVNKTVTADSDIIYIKK